ncbi:hypothetical protein [Streptomyces laurentii]|uniref:hypothetical protein n=1 Tax=Streptomyces laurentii TaxID=39478 RepID=UPI0036A0B098
MTRPDQQAPAAVSDDALFGPEAADYARYRPGLPNAAVHLLAATHHGVPAPVLLDLGTGTGQVPRALLPVLHRRRHVLPPSTRALVRLQSAWSWHHSVSKQAALAVADARAAAEPVAGVRIIDRYAVE